MNDTNPSISIAAPHPAQMSVGRKLSLALVAIGFLALLVSWAGGGSYDAKLFLVLSLGLISIGGVAAIYLQYKDEPPGVKNNHNWRHSFTSAGTWGWMTGIILTGFYVLIYWFPLAIEELTWMMDPIAKLVRGQGIVHPEYDRWFLYGVLYTLAILIMGVKALFKYRHSSYQVIRTSSVMFFQLAFAFLIPNILMSLNHPYFEWTNIWPLRYYELFPDSVAQLQQGGTMGKFMLFWGVISIAVVTPVLTYFYGKRWYCSWVCGCGGLANTAGDPWRQLSSKKLIAWQIERWMIYAVLVLVIITTGLLWLVHMGHVPALANLSGHLSAWYGFAIGAVFSGVIGVGFYPIMGTRVWCRFGCPMAAILGLQQRFFSRFRITTNGGQCISCGNCSTYCEMGIDVRWYAQRGQNIVRSSCVGCGICSTVCPRGVLNLENGPTSGRVNDQPILIGSESIDIIS
jgi:Pyruvate/2-oxoacid:ferredoxin oxidoreductase delta subunit